MYINGKSIRFKECESDFAPRSDDLRLPIARSDDLAHKIKKKKKKMELLRLKPFINHP